MTCRKVAEKSFFNQKKAGTPLQVIYWESTAPPLEHELAPEMDASLNRRIDPKRLRFSSIVSKEDKRKPTAEMFRVQSVPAATGLRLHTGLQVKLIGLRVEPERESEARRFLERIALRQKVRLEFDEPRYDEDGILRAYVYAENKTFLNAKLIREGYACFDGTGRLAAPLQRCEQRAKKEKQGVWRNKDTSVPSLTQTPLACTPLCAGDLIPARAGSPRPLR